MTYDPGAETEPADELEKVPLGLQPSPGPPQQQESQGFKMKASTVGLKGLMISLGECQDRTQAS